MALHKISGKITPVDILKDAFTDLRQDLEELEYLQKSATESLTKAINEIRSKQKYLPSVTLSVAESLFGNLYNEYKICSDLIINSGKILSQNIYSLDNYQTILEAKNSLYFRLRSLQNLLGTFITLSDWQSPTYDYSILSLAGRQTGQITGTVNDYKRDTQIDSAEFEQKYKKEYVTAFFKLPIHVYATNSGMAAFTTIFTFLLCENKLAGKILVGKSVYFQYKQLLVRSLRDKVIEVDEEDTDGILTAVNTYQPCAIFLDTLSNAKTIPVPNLTVIIDNLKKLIKNDVYLVLDNTCLSIFFQPFHRIIGSSRKVHLITFESLNKYHQFGFDRVTAGIIVALGRDTGKLHEYRKHTGTILSEASVYAIPTPNRKLLALRLMRFERNTNYLALTLNRVRQNKRHIIEKVVYPNLSNHPSYLWSKDLPFHGSFLVLKFKKNMDNPGTYKKFINEVIRQAKREKVQIVAGTSFGMNITRIYLTSLWTKYGEPFLRISTGTEDRLQLEKLTQVFLRTLEKFR